MSNENSSELTEYKVVYSLPDTTNAQEKFFMAENVNVALNTFNFVNRKNELAAKVQAIEKFNRWSNQWESETIPLFRNSEN